MWAFLLGPAGGNSLPFLLLKATQKKLREPVKKKKMWKIPHWVNINKVNIKFKKMGN